MSSQSIVPSDVKINNVLFPIYKMVKIHTNSVVISYGKIENRDRFKSHSTCGITLEQLFALYKRMADLEIGALVLYHDSTSIELEKINIILDPKSIKELSEWAAKYNKDLTDEIEEGIKKSVRVLQEKIGYCHGDLHGGNLGYRLNGDKLQILFIDMDTAFPISIGRYMPTVKIWMEHGFGWTESYDDFVAYDYTNPMDMILENIYTHNLRKY